MFTHVDGQHLMSNFEFEDAGCNTTTIFMSLFALSMHHSSVLGLLFVLEKEFAKHRASLTFMILVEADPEGLGTVL